MTPGAAGSGMPAPQPPSEPSPSLPTPPGAAFFFDDFEAGAPGTQPAAWGIAGSITASKPATRWATRSLHCWTTPRASAAINRSTFTPKGPPSPRC